MIASSPSADGSRIFTAPPMITCSASPGSPWWKITSLRRKWRCRRRRPTSASTGSGQGAKSGQPRSAWTAARSSIEVIAPSVRRASDSARGRSVHSRPVNERPPPTSVIRSDAHLGHTGLVELMAGREVPCFEAPERAIEIERALAADGGFTMVEPEAFGTDPIMAVHDPDLVELVDTVWTDALAAGDIDGSRPLLPDTFKLAAYAGPMALTELPASAHHRLGAFCFDTATPIVAGTAAAARAAVDVALSTAARVVGGERLAYGLCRPPGHHAARGMLGGYCFFNNAAIVAEWLRREGGFARVAILDVDYHHGNGTQQIFWERGDVLYVSLHADPDRAYPYYSGFASETRRRRRRRADAQPPAAGRDRSGWLRDGARPRTGGHRLIRARRTAGAVAGLRHLRARPDWRPGAAHRRTTASWAGWSRAQACRSWRCRRAATRSMPSAPMPGPSCAGCAARTPRACRSPPGLGPARRPAPPTGSPRTRPPRDRQGTARRSASARGTGSSAWPRRAGSTRRPAVGRTACVPAAARTTPGRVPACSSKHSNWRRPCGSCRRSASAVAAIWVRVTRSSAGATGAGSKLIEPTTDSSSSRSASWPGPRRRASSRYQPPAVSGRAMVQLSTWSSPSVDSR